MTRILEILDNPPRRLGRVPGPVTILYYLQKDPSLTEGGCVLPRSTRTIWRILDRYHRIQRPGRREHEELERPEPGVEWDMDFHDVSTVIKKLPIKGLQNRRMAFENFVDWMAREAESAWRRYLRRTPTYARGTM